MRNTFFIIFIVLFCANAGLARGGHCGTEKFIQFNRELQANPSIGKVARTTIADAGSCETEDYYDTVYSKSTKHFQIFYTLNGPHKTTKEFVDSLAVYAEFAFKFHTEKLDMLPPAGQSSTIHYQQNVEAGLYPIEIIEIDKMRDIARWLGGMCHGCFGVTIPHKTEIGASELLIDNDFRYIPETNATIDTVKFHGKNCTYKVSSEELENEYHNYSYAEQWDKALRVTAIHELYHAVQIRYLDLYKHYTFWFEASASGIEEIVAPDIDDYYTYLPGMFRSMGTPLNIADTAAYPNRYANITYGSGIFLMYLYKFIDKKIDNFVWKRFSEKPGETLSQHLAAYAKKENLDIDSIFHDFSTRLALSGEKTSFIDSSEWITGDQYFWPDFNYIASDNSTANFEPQTTNFAYEFYMNGKPVLDNFKGDASIILFKKHTAKITKLRSINSVDSAFMEASLDSQIDSVGWIFSRFNNDKYLPEDTKTLALHAYPMPWRGGNLCFAPLPENKKYIEIRNRRGDLITRLAYESRSICIDEATVKDMMAPGVYRFRVGDSGKTKDFLIIY